MKKLNFAVFEQFLGGNARVSSGVAKHALKLLGPFRLDAPDGQRVDVSSKKGQALIAMLAMAGGGERTRSWLQTQLWGSRNADQAQASLRSELATLRTRINTVQWPLLKSDHNRVWLDLQLLDVDARGQGNVNAAEFLEGLDIAGEDGFEDWLREERGRQQSRSADGLQRRKPEADGIAGNDKPPQIAPVNAAFSDLPAIAVLPFANKTTNPELDYVAEGLSEDMIDRLARLRWLPVIARSSSFSLSTGDTSSAAIGKLLGARYLLEGNLRQNGESTTINASLSDCETGKLLWSSKIAFEKDASTAALEQIVSGMTSMLGLKIDAEEQRRARGKRHEDLTVRDLIWRGRWHLNRLTEQDFDQAKALFEKALEIEPNSPEAIIQYSWALLWAGWTKRISEDETRNIRRLAQKAIIADYEDARGHMLAGVAETWLRQPLRAEALLRRAIELNPSLALAHAQMGDMLYLRGEPEAALESLRVAVRLSPHDQQLFFVYGELAVAHLMLGNFEEALTKAETSLLQRPAYWFAHVMRINALVRLERAADAKAALEELRAQVGRFKLAYLDWIPFIDPHWNAYLKEGLNRADNHND